MNSSWDIIYESAIKEDGSLLFPGRMSKEFLEAKRRTMGSYFYANQYMNQCIPEDEKRFKKEWFRYFQTITNDNLFNFGFIDPAIGQKEHHDYTGVVIVSVDHECNWYVRVANRYRITPTEIVSKMFDICDTFKLHSLGVETQAYQEALLYILDDEMKRRKKVIPVTGIKRASISKASRILGLVPRFEWGKIYLANGLHDLEDELAAFPRGTFDDLMDGLASIENIVHYPQKEKKEIKQPQSPLHPDYEKWYISQLSQRRKENE